MSVEHPDLIGRNQCEGKKKSLLEISNDMEFAGCAFWDTALWFQEGA